MRAELVALVLVVELRVELVALVLVVEHLAELVALVLVVERWPLMPRRAWYRPRPGESDDETFARVERGIERRLAAQLARRGLVLPPSSPEDAPASPDVPEET